MRFSPSRRAVVVRLVALASSVLLALAATPLLAEAQYFGQNKVQYERFDFQVLRTDSFDIYHYPEEAEAVGHAARLAEQWRARLARALGFEMPGRQPLVLYASHPHFTQTQVLTGLIGEGTGGVTESLKRRMVMPFGSTLGETSHVLGHEMVHAFQYSVGAERIGALPLWFIEGMAEYLSIGPDHAHTAMWLRDLAQQETLPGFKDLDNPRYFPYRYGHAAWAYLASRFGPAIVGDAFLEAARTGNALIGLENTTGVAIDELSADWHAEIRRRHGSRRDGAVAGRPLVADDSPRGGGTLNVSPSLSPDGRWLAYLSERGLFSIDLYLADAATGRVVRRLTRTDTDPHIESLQFIASAGAWDAASARFAYVTVTRGKATVVVVDVAGRGGDRAFPLDAVDEAWHPTWSPDGRSLAFAGLSGGTSDLYVLELAGGTVRRLTNDAFADLQPAWSPDGRRLAFVTDRFSSSLETLAFGEPRLALLTVATGAVEPLPALASGKHINPQWDADGTGLYLVAEPDGIANIYRLDLATRSYGRVTSVGTGVTGITELSPALSFAPRVNRLAFSVFRGGGYDIRVLDAPAGGAVPQTLTAAATSRSASVLFAERAGAAASTRPGTEGARAPAVDVSQVEPYDPALSLDVAGASGGIGASNRYGAMFGGGVGMQFSDMLGDHTLGAYLSANGGVRDIGGQAIYINRASRWNWGGAAMLQPYVTGSFGQSVEQTADGRQVVLEQEYSDPPDRRRPARHRGLSLQPGAAVRGAGRRAADLVRPRTDDPHLRCRHRPAVERAARRLRCACRAQPGRGSGGARLRSVGLRSDQPDQRAALSLRGHADVRVTALHQPHARLPPLPAARAPGHLCRARAACRPLRRRGRRRPADPALPGLPLARPRLQRRFVRHRRRLRNDSRRPLSGLRRAARIAVARRQRGTALPAARRVQRRLSLRPAADRRFLLRR